LKNSLSNPKSGKFPVKPFIGTTKLKEAFMQHYKSTQESNISPNQHSLSQADVYASSVLAFLVLIIPMLVFVGFNAYKKHRVAVLRQQIATLERLWQINIKNKY
jgi:hypothetical protein